MPRFMLDTDTCSYIMKRLNPALSNRLQATPIDDVCMSVVTKAELLYGVEASPRRALDATALCAFLTYVHALDFPDDALPTTDCFCAGQAFLTDGRLLSGGGTFGWAESH